MLLVFLDGKIFLKTESNQMWSADFTGDALRDGRRFQTFNVVDDFNREVLVVEIDAGISAQRVVRIRD